MDYSPAPAQPPVSKQAIESLINIVLMYIYTCVSALMLFATFSIVVTRFRLWHDNKFLKKITQLANNPVNGLINQAIGFASAYQNDKDVPYMIWVVILLIAFNNIFHISCYSLLESATDRRSREYCFLYNFIITGLIIIKYKASSEFHHLLLALMSLVLAKFLIRIRSYVLAERAYGLENINLVAEYMKSEHKLTQPSDAIDPTCMKGYKYLVMGEEKIESKIEAPDYSPVVELTDDVITVERVWSCKRGLLHPSVDTDGAMKDVCLSFALFKLLRRRNFGYPAAEAQQSKTRQLIFEGLLSEKGDKERIFRVIKLELGFLRDLIFTRYPVGFAIGFPVSNLVLFGGMIGVTLWIKYKAYLNRNKYASFNNHPLDYLLTSSLLILIVVMEFFEVLTYVFCDWTKVIMICQNVKRKSSIVRNQWASSDSNSHEAQPWLFGYKVLALFCKPRFYLSVKNTLRQYELLRNISSKTYPRSSGRCYSLISTCEVSKINATPPGLKKDKTIPLSPEVKKAIFDTLVENRGRELTNGMATLQRNGESVYEDLKWTLDLATPVHTIMVWHIATSFCKIHPENVGGNKESIKSDLTVATHLSNYCAYLVAFLPDMLPLTSNQVKNMFRKIVGETSEFFAREHTLEAKYKKMKSYRDGGQKIIHRGSELGQYLIDKIPDDAQRWKLMADFWSEFTLYLAPKGSTIAHRDQLCNGSEFITHLWALLYHAGIIDTTSAEYHPLEVVT